MFASLPVLTDINAGTTVLKAVNLDNVNFVEPSGDNSLVTFASGATATVKCTVAAFVAAFRITNPNLDLAGNDLTTVPDPNN